MFSMGASAVIAVDVGSVSQLVTLNNSHTYSTHAQIDDNSPRNFGDSLSGWWLVLNRWNPFSNVRNIPAIPEIQSRLA